MEYLSASKLKKFRKCPYSLQEPFTSNAATNFGTAVHAGIAEWFRGNPQYFVEGYIKHARMLEVSTLKDPEASLAIDYAKSLGIDKDSVVTIESDDGNVHYFDKNFFEIQFTSKWGIRGAMDLVYIDDSGNLNIVDWKTGMSKEDDDLQLAIYALCAYKKYGSFPSIRTTFAYVQQNTTQSSNWDAESLTSALNYLKPLVEDYLEETSKPKSEWKRTPHKNCCYCSLKDTCPAYFSQIERVPEPNAYEIPATLENLPKIVDFKAKIDSILKAALDIADNLRQKQIQILSECGGKVDLNGRTVQIKERVGRYNYDLAKIFVETNNLIGRPPIELCSYSSSGATEFKKNLSDEQKKAFEEIVNSSKTVSSKVQTVAVSISKEPIEEEAENE